LVLARLRADGREYTTIYFLGGRGFAREILGLEARRWQSHRTPKVLDGFIATDDGNDGDAVTGLRFDFSSAVSRVAKRAAFGYGGRDTYMSESTQPL
jgi:hypothetical protein